MLWEVRGGSLNCACPVTASLEATFKSISWICYWKSCPVTASLEAFLALLRLSWKQTWEHLGHKNEHFVCIGSTFLKTPYLVSGVEAILVIDVGASGP